MTKRLSAFGNLCVRLMVLLAMVSCTEHTERPQWKDDALRIAADNNEPQLRAETHTLVVLDPADCLTCDPTLAAALERARNSANNKLCLLRKPTDAEHRQLVLQRLGDTCIVSARIRRALKRSTILDVKDSSTDSSAVTVVWSLRP